MALRANCQARRRRDEDVIAFCDAAISSKFAEASPLRQEANGLGASISFAALLSKETNISAAKPTSFVNDNGVGKIAACIKRSQSSFHCRPVHHDILPDRFVEPEDSAR